MTLDEVLHQKSGGPQGPTERTAARRGEAASEAVSDEAESARHAQTSRGAGDLLWQVLARENMVRPPGHTQILLTSTSRTARCGPACRVVWEGSGLKRPAPIPIERSHLPGDPGSALKPSTAKRCPGARVRSPRTLLIAACNEHWLGV